jgi:aspergillopepsin I
VQRTSLWYVPSEVADAYWSTVESADNELIGNWVFSCKETLPDITVVIGGKKVTIPGINMNYQTLGTAGLCLGGIQEATSGIPAIAGDVFLKNLFVAFESPVGAQARLGFAQT